MTIALTGGGAETVLTFSPCGAPSNAGEPGEVGAADRGAGVAFGGFYWRPKESYPPSRRNPSCPRDPARPGFTTPIHAPDAAAKCRRLAAASRANIRGEDHGSILACVANP